MALDPAIFRATLARFASGVTIITARDDAGRDVGMTVSAFNSLSLTPPMVLVCIDKAASVGPVLERCETFAVNVLADSQEALSRRFAQKDIERFDGVSVERGELGLPLLTGALAQIECRVANRVPGGDHTILIGEVRSAAARDGQPLLYFRGAYRQLNP